MAGQDRRKFVVTTESNDLVVTSPPYNLFDFEQHIVKELGFKEFRL